MVSKARLDLPEPESPVTTMSLSRGISTEMFFRLCTRAPCTAMVVRAALTAGWAVLVAILRFPHIYERLFLHQDVASLRELNGSRNLADEPPVSQVLARRRDSLHVEIPLEMGLDLGRRTRFAHLAQVIEHQPEQRGRSSRQVLVDGVERRLHFLPCLLGIQQIGIDDPEERRIELHRLEE